MQTALKIGVAELKSRRETVQHLKGPIQVTANSKYTFSSQHSSKKMRSLRPVILLENDPWDGFFSTTPWSLPSRDAEGKN